MTLCMAAFGCSGESEQAAVEDTGLVQSDTAADTLDMTDEEIATDASAGDGGVTDTRGEDIPAEVEDIPAEVEDIPAEVEDIPTVEVVEDVSHDVPEEVSDLDVADVGDVSDVVDVGDAGDLSDMADSADLADMNDAGDSADTLDTADLRDTSSEPDVPIGPTVLSSTPADAAEMVDPTGGSITIVFSESMASAKFPAVVFFAESDVDFVEIPNTHAELVWATTTVADDTLVIDSAWGNFPENETIRWTLTASGLENLSGIQIAEDVVRQFSTTTRDITFPLVGTGQTSCFYYDSGWIEDADCSEDYIVGDANYPFGQDAHHGHTLPDPLFLGPSILGGPEGEYMTAGHPDRLNWMSCPVGMTGNDCAGTAGTFNWYNAFDACSEVAANDYGARDDWRVPTATELLTLIIHDPAFTAAIDLDGFPGGATGEYISSTGVYVASGAGDAYRVSYLEGAFQAQSKINSGRLRCVSDQIARDTPRSYFDNGDGTITDFVSGLRWQQCTNTIEAGPCDGTYMTATWAEAMAFCENLELGDDGWVNRGSWRLPNQSELRSLFEFGDAVTIEGDFFQRTGSHEDVAHSTTRTRYGAVDTIMTAEFKGRLVPSTSKDGPFVVRCVATNMSDEESCLSEHHTPPTVGCADNDGDGYGVGDDCLGTDCDDDDPFTYPGAAVSESELGCTRDADGDGWGDDTVSGTVVPGTDCDDDDFLRHPEAAELPNDGVDNACGLDGDLVPSNDTGIFVAVTGNDDTALGTMDDPVLTINHALDLALDGDVVFVSEGEYVEDVLAFESLYGGYESTGWTRDLDANTTTIRAATVNRALYMGTAGSVVEGFTIVGEPGIYAVKSTSIIHNQLFGGSENNSLAVRIMAAADGSVLAFNTIDGGTGINSVMGVLVQGDTIIAHNTFLQTADSKTATDITIEQDATVIIRQNTFEPASGALQKSIAINHFLGTSTIERNTIHAGPVAPLGSTGVQVYTGHVDLVGNLIVAETAGSIERSVYAIGSASINLINNTLISLGRGIEIGTLTEAVLINNVIVGDSTAVYLRPGGPVTLIGNAMWGGEGFCPFYVFGAGQCMPNCFQINLCRWQGCVEAAGNFAADPMLVEPGTGKYELSEGSPCIDGGVNPGRWFDRSVGVDLNGQERGDGSGWDIGAYQSDPGD